MTHHTVVAIAALLFAGGTYVVVCEWVAELLADKSGPDPELTAAAPGARAGARTIDELEARKVRAATVERDTTYFDADAAPDGWVTCASPFGSIVHVSPLDDEIIEFPVTDGWDEDAILSYVAEIEAL